MIIMTPSIRGVLCLAALVAAICLPAKAKAEMPGGETHWLVSADRLEYQSNEGTGLFVWDAQGWWGGDYDKLWIKSEGETKLHGGSVEEAELQALYSRAISPFWDIQFGLRHDFHPHPSRSYGAFSVQGLAPHWFDVDASAFISEEGDISARLEVEYDLLLTQRLILQPRFETNFAIQEVSELGVGSGVNNVELDARLRYEISREFAPYMGISWTRKLGKTADLTRAGGGSVDTASFLLGLKVWY